MLDKAKAENRKLKSELNRGCGINPKLPPECDGMEFVTVEDGYGCHDCALMKDGQCVGVPGYGAFVDVCLFHESHTWSGIWVKPEFLTPWEQPESSTADAIEATTAKNTDKDTGRTK